MAKLYKQPHPINIKLLDLKEIKPRERQAGHLWCDKQTLRMFKGLFNRKDYKNLRNVYLTLCQIDSDFCEAREEFLAGNEIAKDRDLHSLTKTCASYSGMDRKTVIKYMQILRDLTLIKYGRKQDGDGRVIGSYLILFEYIPFTDYYKTILGLKSEEQLEWEKHLSTVSGTMGHSPKKPTKAKRDRIKNVNRSIKNESKDSKTLSNERVIPEATSGFNGKPLLLRIKRRKRKVNNGKLFDSSKPRRYKTIPLDSWNQHPLNKKSKYDPPVIALQSKIMRIKKPMVNEIQEVIDYWNKNASQLSNNGHKLPTHRLDLDTKTSYMCKLIVTGILHTSNLTVDDIKKAIDNYTKVLENSHYYTHLYSFPQFYSKEIFSDCIEGNLSKYIKQKKKLTKEGLLEAAKREHKLIRGYPPTYEEEQFYKGLIYDDHIKTEDDARRHAM